MFIIVNRSGEDITGAVNNEPFGVPFSEERYKLMKELEAKANTASSMDELLAIVEDFKPLTQVNYKEVVEHKSPYLYVNSSTGKFFLKVGFGENSVVSSKPLPTAFVDRIIKSIDEAIDILPLVKGWMRFLRNPFYNSKKASRFANYINKTYTNHAYAAQLESEFGLSPEVALRRATTLQTPLTQEGLIQTYKVSAELKEKWILDQEGNKKQVPINQAKIDPVTGIITYDVPQHVEDRLFYPAIQGLTGGDAFYSGDELGHLIRVGKRHRLESWDQVNTNDDQSAVKGLHAGNLDYIRGFQTANTVTHDVFVDPMNIGAFTDDGTGALRLLEYFVYASHAGVNNGIYHSSTYAQETDNAYAKMFEDAVLKYRETADTREARLNEKQALTIL